MGTNSGSHCRECDGVFASCSLGSSDSTTEKIDAECACSLLTEFFDAMFESRDVTVCGGECAVFPSYARS